MLYLPSLASFAVVVLVLYLDGHLSNYVLLCVSRVAVCTDGR
jgi:hypothetical protein